jgi:hypothetical protein
LGITNNVKNIEIFLKYTKKKEKRNLSILQSAGKVIGVECMQYKDKSKSYRD